jgi:hypothetical protein
MLAKDRDPQNKQAGKTNKTTVNKNKTKQTK